jgi:hypothetical protein
MVVEGDRVLSFLGAASVANLRPGVEPRGRERRDREHDRYERRADPGHPARDAIEERNPP